MKRLIPTFFLAAIGPIVSASVFLPLMDTQLARYPIVVVGQWEGVPLTTRYEKARGVFKRSERRASFRVLRSIEGNVNAGRHSLIMKDVDIDEKGEMWGDVSSPSEADVSDIRKPCLIFLRRTPSIDPNDKGPHLTVTDIRCFQPLSLETYFHVLRQPNAKEMMEPLLLCGETDVVVRALNFVNGNCQPIPFMEKYVSKDLDRFLPLRQYEQAAQQLTNSDDLKVRRKAVGVYAEMVGKKRRSLLVPFLKDPDGETALYATAYLTWWRDEAALDSLDSVMSKVVSDGGIDTLWLLRSLLPVLGDWNRLEAVPAMIRLLDWSSDASIPLSARHELARLTAFQFPVDQPAEKSLTAWRAAVAKPPDERLSYLTSQLGIRKIEAKLRKEKGSMWVDVRNASDRGLRLATDPRAEWDLDYANGETFGGGTLNVDATWFRGDKINSENKWLVLQPGERVSYEIRRDEDDYRHLFEKGNDRLTVTLRFVNQGQNPRLSWLGAIEVHGRARAVID